MGVLHNELKRAGGIQAALQNALGMKSGGIERAGETMTPVMDLWSLPEWQVLRNETPGAARVSQAAVPAEFSIVALVNPAVNANMIVVVEQAGFQGTGANGGHLEMALESQAVATLGAGTATVSRDRRVPSICRTTTRLGSDPAATLGGQPIDTILPIAAGTKVNFDALPVILIPGQCLAIICATVNVGMLAMFRFRERVALPGELLTKT